MNSSENASKFENEKTLKELFEMNPKLEGTVYQKRCILLINTWIWYRVTYLMLKLGIKHLLKDGFKIEKFLVREKKITFNYFEIKNGFTIIRVRKTHHCIRLKFLLVLNKAINRIPHKTHLIINPFVFVDGFKPFSNMTNYRFKMYSKFHYNNCKSESSFFTNFNTMKISDLNEKYFENLYEYDVMIKYLNKKMIERCEQRRNKYKTKDIYDFFKFGSDSNAIVSFMKVMIERRCNNK